MTSVDMTAITAVINGMEGQIGALKALLQMKMIQTKSDSSSAAIKEKKVPNAWIIFSQRVQHILSTAGEDKKLPIGQSQQFASYLKAHKEMSEWLDEEILEQRSTWTAPIKVVSEGESVDSEKRRGPKKLVDMTAEEKAEHDRKVIARREAKVASGEATTKKKTKKVSEMNAEELVKYRAKQEKAKIAKAAKVTTSTASPSEKHEEIVEESAEESDAVEDDTFKKTTIKGKNYLINDNGFSYKEENGIKGEWSGVYNKKTGKFDTSVEEP